MGHVYATVRFRGSAGEREVSALVDTGSTYTVIPPELAQEIGVLSLPEKFRLRLANGHRVAVEAGTVSVTVLRRTVPVTVAILPGAEALLGVEALEALGLRVDPATGKLVPSRSYAARL